MNTRWLLSMARWAHKPPSAKRVKFVLSIVLLCLVIYGLDQIFNLSDGLEINPRGRMWRP